MSIIGATILRFILVRLNKKLDQGAYIGNDGRLVEATSSRDAEDQGVRQAAVGKEFRFLV